LNSQGRWVGIAQTHLNGDSLDLASTTVGLGSASNLVALGLALTRPNRLLGLTPLILYIFIKS